MSEKRDGRRPEDAERSKATQEEAGDFADRQTEIDEEFLRAGLTEKPTDVVADGELVGEDTQIEEARTEVGLAPPPGASETTNRLAKLRAQADKLIAETSTTDTIARRIIEEAFKDHPSWNDPYWRHVLEQNNREVERMETSGSNPKDRQRQRALRDADHLITVSIEEFAERDRVIESLIEQSEEIAEGHIFGGRKIDYEIREFLAGLLKDKEESLDKYGQFLRSKRSGLGFFESLGGAKKVIDEYIKSFEQSQKRLTAKRVSVESTESVGDDIQILELDDDDMLTDPGRFVLEEPDRIKLFLQKIDRNGDLNVLDYSDGPEKQRIAEEIIEKATEIFNSFLRSGESVAVDCRSVIEKCKQEIEAIRSDERIGIHTDTPTVNAILIRKLAHEMALKMILRLADETGSKRISQSNRDGVVLPDAHWTEKLNEELEREAKSRTIDKKEEINAPADHWARELNDELEGRKPSAKLEAGTETRSEVSPKKRSFFGRVSASVKSVAKKVLTIGGLLLATDNDRDATENELSAAPNESVSDTGERLDDYSDDTEGQHETNLANDTPIRSTTQFDYLSKGGGLVNSQDFWNQPLSVRDLPDVADDDIDLDGYEDDEVKQGSERIVYTREIPRGSSIWEESNKILQEMGIKNPKNADLVNIAKLVKAKNGISDATKIAAGTKLDFTPAIDEGMKILQRR